MSDLRDHLRSGMDADTDQESLALPVTALLGVSPEAGDRLAVLGIRTIFDLATSTLFHQATKVAWASDYRGLLARFGRVPADLIDDDLATRPVEQLADLPVDALRALGKKRGSQLADALDVTTLRELAAWPPYRAAQGMLQAAFGTELDTADAEAPSELVPKAGDYPTERVQYESILLDSFLERDPDRFELRPSALAAARGNPFRDLVASGSSHRPLESAGTVDVSEAAQESFGFTVPAVGAVLSFTQSWYTAGLALGHLLHTLALAPGESTRVAMIDWTRRSRAGTTESIDETEYLRSDLERSRSISEVINTVAREVQSGSSGSSGFGIGSGAGYGSGAAATGVLDGFNLGAAVGQALGLSVGASESRSWSVSSGRRDIAASMTQQINDRTHQSATSVRNRRATIVREVYQAERERITTRSVTNYNHMHALSIEYYEIVQLYRVATELARVTPCLFVPVRRLDFRRPGVLARFRQVIAGAGLTAGVRGLDRAEPGSVLVASPTRSAPWRENILLYLTEMFGTPVGTPTEDALVFPAKFIAAALSFDEDKAIDRLIVEQRSGRRFEYRITDRTENDVDRYGPHRAIIDWDADGLQGARRETANITRIRLRKAARSEDVSGALTVYLTLDWVGDPDETPPTSELTEGMVHFRVDIDIPADTTEFTVFELSRTPGDIELFDHLDEHALHYSQAVWRSLDAATVSLLMAGYSLGGRPLAEAIDPTPIGVAGNYLMFRYPELLGSPEWQTFVTERGLTLGSRQEELVPLPSGGVFAEAVLGRFNSAEKLDMTRFWNWQDSPIPLPPPEIAAIASGSRAEPEDLTPGQLGQPVLNVVNAPSVPDPQGLSAALAALANGSMFRDMSGLAGTTAFAQNALTTALAGAARFAEQAGANAATAASLLGAGGAARPTSPPTISNAGARINQGERLDRRRLEGASANGEQTRGDGGAGISTPGPTRNNGSGRVVPGDFGQSAERDAFYRDLGYPDISLTAGGRAPAQTTGLGSLAGEARRTPSTGLRDLFPKLIDWAIDLGTAAIGAEEGRLAEALADAAFEIARGELQNTVDAVPFARAFRLALRYSITFADGAGVVINSSRTQIQRLVDEAASFSDDMTDAEYQRLGEARRWQALGWSSTLEALQEGLANAVNQVIDDATGLLADAAGHVAQQYTDAILSRLLSAAKVDRVMLAISREVESNVPQARRQLYARLATKLTRLLIATYADSPAQRARLTSALAAVSSAENPSVGLLRSLVELALSDLANDPLGQSIGIEGVVTIERLVQHECKRAAKAIIDELKQAGWRFDSHSGPTGIVVDNANRWIDLPARARAELENGPSGEEMGLLEEDLAMDEAAYATIVDALDAGILLRGIEYQRAIDTAPNYASALTRFRAGRTATDSDAVSATNATQAVAAALQSVYAGSALAPIANDLLHAVPLRPVAIVPPQQPVAST